MKKVRLFVIPLMTMSTLVSCGGGDKPKTYNVTIAQDHDHLSFLTTDEKDLDGTNVIEKQDLTFKMKALEGSYDFIVPDTLDITIGGEVITDYEMIVEESGKEANVIISGDKIIGDINISGRADIKNGYRYEAPYLYGVTAELGEGIHIKDDRDLTIEFEAEENGYSLPEAENIYIELDNFDGQKVWFSPSEGFDDICTYNDGTGELTIKLGAEEYIKSNVVIVARASDYNLLETTSWEQINDFAVAGIAENIFYLGEEKKVNIYGKDHTVRIIDFNRDVDAEGNKIGITFEFANLINDTSGAEIKWDNKNTNFINSSFNNKLNGDSDNSVLSELKKDPADGLGNYIKQTTKKVNVKENDKWINKSYDTYLFPLTYNEMGKDDKTGIRYAYYQNATSSAHEKRKKTFPGETNSRNYWTRSPRLSGGGNYVMFFTADGAVEHDSPGTKKCFAPAFCI